MPGAASTSILSRPSWAESRRVAEILRRETVGGVLLLIAATAALVWSNSPVSSSYFEIRDTVFGPASLKLDLTVGEWAGDGLLAIFFFVAGLELKREFVAGDLRDPRRAMLPVGAAIGGVVVPALIFVAINASTGGDALRGWAIPTATDIAFALAVLAVVGSRLPVALRTFLLTLAVVDDLIAIIIIAVFFTESLNAAALAAAMVPLAVFAVVVQRGISRWWVLLPLAAATWTLVHASGVHATVAGVLLAFTVPVLRRASTSDEASDPGLAEHFEHRIRPISAGIAVPLFALFSAGVLVGGIVGLRDALTDPVAIGIIAGLVVGKPIGILLATAALAKGTRAKLDPSLNWWDVAGLSMLAGIGFTVSLLIGELAYGIGTLEDNRAKVAVLIASVTSAFAATVFLRVRARRYRAIQEEETRDADGDGIPDYYQAPK